jgi:hypothetical protein
MFIFISSRRTGKTEKIVTWYMEKPNHRIIVCPDENQRQHILDRIQDRYPGHRKYAERSVLTSYKVQTGALKGTHYTELAVDNAEWLLEQYIGRRIDFLTMTGTSFEEPPEEQKKKSWWMFWKGNNGKK